MFSKFFIDRPIFANVIAILTVLVGGVALYNLPVEQYPRITPPRSGRDTMSSNRKQRPTVATSAITSASSLGTASATSCCPG